MNNLQQATQVHKTTATNVTPDIVFVT